MQNKTQEKCYSIDGERYYSYKELMRRLLESYNKGEEVEVFEADKKEYNHLDFINNYGVIEDMQSAAMDECGEFAEEYLNEITDEDKCDLAMRIADWFDKNAKINFYGLENERKIMVIVE